MSDQPTEPAQPGQPRPGGDQSAHPHGGSPQAYPQHGYAQQAGYPNQPGYPPQAYPPQGGYPPQRPQQGDYPPQQPYPEHTAPTRSSPLGSLGDIRFTRRITPGLATVVYLAVIVLAVLATIVGIIAALGAFAAANNPFIGNGAWVFYGMLLLIATPLTAFVWVAFARFLLEYFLDRASEAPRQK